MRHCNWESHLTKLEHLDILGFLLELSQLGLGGGSVLQQLHMLMPQLALPRLQLCSLICQLLLTRYAAQ